MTRAEYELMVDLDRTSLFDTGEDIIDDVLGSPGIVVERGHDQTRVLSPPIAGVGSFVLNNESGDYSPDGDLRAGEAVRLRATFDGTTYDVWRGVLDQPQQTPPGNQVKFTNVGAFGSMARLAGRKVSSALYADITTDEAIGHLLDEAGFPKNVQGYTLGVTNLFDVTAASFLAYGAWDLASTSGDDPNESPIFSSPAVITLGGGVRASDAIDDSGTKTLEFDGAATKATVTDVSFLQEIFNTGGLALCLFNPDSDGESHEGTLIGKNAWRFYVADQSGSDMRLRFTHNYSTTAGIWETTSRVVTVGTSYLVAVWFDRSGGVAADPTIWLFDIDSRTFSELTVGSGLTETQTPVGTVSTDTGSDLVIGNNSGASRTFDGRIGTVRVFRSITGLGGTAADWGVRMHYIASAAADAPRHFDTGKTTLSWWWLDAEDALTALETLKNSEGPGAALYEDATGALVFKNRHARATEARSTSAQTTFDSVNDTEPVLAHPFSFDRGLKDVVNICEVETVRREEGSLVEVWSLGENLTLAPGEIKRITGRSSDPFMDAAIPSVVGGDYTAVSGTIDQIWLARDSGTQVKINLTSTDGATISGLRLRGKPVTVVNTSVASNTLDTQTSIDDYGPRTYRIPTRKEIGFNVAVDFCNAVVGYYKAGRPVATITLDTNVADERMEAALEREVGDRVQIVVDDIDEEMYVEHIRHEVYAPSTQRTTLGLEAADVARPFILDTSVLDGADVLAF